MAVPPAIPLTLEGPAQGGRGVHGQYVYWIVMPYPTEEIVAQSGVKIPDDFDHRRGVGGKRRVTSAPTLASHRADFL